MDPQLKTLVEGAHLIMDYIELNPWFKGRIDGLGGCKVPLNDGDIILNLNLTKGEIEAAATMSSSADLWVFRAWCDKRGIPRTKAERFWHEAKQSVIDIGHLDINRINRLNI